MPPDTETNIDDAPRSGLSRRQVLQRLAVGGAVVWATPLISQPAYAATAASCTPRVLNWNTRTVGTTFTSANVSGTTVTLSTSFFGGSAALGTNRTIIAGPQGGIAGNALRLEQDPTNNGGQRVRFTFSQEVFNVSFTITDIDNSSSGNWSDRIIVRSPAAFTYSIPSGGRVIGNGAATGSTNTTGPFRNRDANINLPNTSNEGNVTLGWVGGLTFVEFDFACSTPSGGTNQLINITNINFCA